MLLFKYHDYDDIFWASYAFQSDIQRVRRPLLVEALSSTPHLKPRSIIDVKVRICVPNLFVLTTF